MFGYSINMAIKKRVARKPRRRVAKRKGQVLTNVNRSLQPFATRYIAKMKYATTIATSALNGQFIFNLNSIFDPDRTGVGHQPYGYDSLATIYNRYRVISCGWRVQHPMASAGVPVTIGCIASNDLGISWTDTGELLENPRAKYITQLPGSTAVTLRGKQHLPTLVGRTKTQYMSDDQYQANVTTSPSENCLLYLQTFASTNGFPTPSQPLQVVLEYTVEWFDSKRLIQS